ncbi:exporter of the RND superfamily protein [Halorhabdus utahensis DSM 12940]|uniref:Exporter of the RND superfamily protein n=1 Tax=Halorhabdus utahensis (strain DSM 12940 / JCM 11049 / AX-2) TaxID=519442 RepID=C7NR87_HALUD|nr:MMPL family transporter [Halorhabdus utahensis]ACV13079.1 exporter of the RND superfamily protein [Halorhabdus utahensis DSM 12940]
MSLTDRVVDAITDHTKAAIAVMLVLTVLIGAGAAEVEQTSSLDQFQSDTPEAEDLDYIERNFSTGPDNTTTAQIIVRGENVLSNSTLIETLEYQQTLKDNSTVGPTLSGASPTAGVANAIATAAIQRERGAELQATLAEFQTLNATVQEQRQQLQAERTALQQNRTEFNQSRRQLETRAQRLNATAESLQSALTTLRQDPSASVRDQFDAVAQNTPVTLNETHYVTFRTAAQNLRNATDQESIQAAYELGTRGVLSAQYQALGEREQSLRAWGEALQQRGTALQEQGASLRQQGERLEELGAQLQEQRAALENVSAISLDEQIAQLQSMNATELESTIELVLGGENGGGNGVLGLMSSEYEQGSTTAEATMLLVTQRTDSAVAPGGTVSDRIVDSQLAMQDLGGDFDEEYLVFGSGLITDEINRSMTDSMLIVGPLALIFVLAALAIGYRDILDIVLGLFGIGAVLIWTFGFMGWADISFNQIFIAVPVLLIGLSIDYAIHIFMRHRERRNDADRGPREAMRVALGGVGVALTLVTATTVIGFLSNLTSPVPPIQDFGIVSSVGIVAALLVFGVLIPALKVELDEVLEGFGIDRRKRAIGTGGGRLSQLLKVGSIGARKAPYIIIVLAVLLSVGGAYAGTQVDTSFAQEDFLAEDPPGWMEELPEPFKPGEYTAKNNLQYVNDRFVREDSQAQLLIRDDVATADGTEQLAEARETIAEKDVTQKLPGGQPDVQSPLSVIEAVAAQNETFNATLSAADTDNDRVPDENVAGVYDTLYDVAPQQAQAVLYRDDGEYAAARIVVTIQGTASSTDVTDQMRSVADSLSANGLETSATGQTIIFEIVQNQLLETVIQSLLITLVAVFAFLMVVYRISDGSATLGFVTLLPVVLSVAWILGTMYAFGIPFNVMTGMITSLTVGLGVAYSIHLSERYNQELEETGSAFEALDRAVTGTGGALLGSAATTVGGFGVLVFAILPPLQQFGLITGLTIIYAFLASVLVLPSLLVVWTRLFGPEDVFGGGESSDDADDADGDSGTMDTADTDPASASRTLAPSHQAPGGTVAVTLSVDNPADRLAVRERLPGSELAVYSVTPEPTEFVGQGSTLFLAFEGVEDRIVIEYDATIAADTTDGSTLSFDGTVFVDGETIPIDGPDSVTVETDIVERVVSRDEVSDDDLRLAADHFATGQLTDAEFEAVCERWVETDPA